MLELLAMRKGLTLTKEMFLSHLYGGMDEPEMKIIDVFICKLRKKLANASGGKDWRNNAPVSTGVEVRRPNSSPLRPSSFPIGIPMTPNISHTAKQTTNAHVVTPSTMTLRRFDSRRIVLPRWRANRLMMIDFAVWGLCDHPSRRSIHKSR